MKTMFGEEELKEWFVILRALFCLTEELLFAMETMTSLPLSSKLAAQYVRLK